MATFTVRHEETSVGYFDVDAESESEAIDVFWQMVNNCEIDFSGLDIIDSRDTVCDNPKELKGNGIEAAESLLDFVNSFSCEYEQFAKKIAADHKTLQQSVMRLFIATIREMANVTPDARNEQTVELAKKIVEIADGYSLPLI